MGTRGKKKQNPQSQEMAGGPGECTKLVTWIWPCLKLDYLISYVSSHMSQPVPSPHFSFVSLNQASVTCSGMSLDPIQEAASVFQAA